MTNKQGPIFVSCAHQGKGSQFISLCEDSLFAANMEHSTWTDQEIESGDKWQEKIESALSEASAAVAADAKPQVTPERLLPGHPGGTRTDVDPARQYPGICPGLFRNKRMIGWTE